MSGRGAGQGYARGRWAVAECARSGIKFLLRNAIADGYYPNLIVHPSWYEPKHPQESLPSIKDPVALYRPAPERDKSGREIRIGSGPGFPGAIFGDDDVPGGGFGGGSDHLGTGSLSMGFQLGRPTIETEDDTVIPDLIFLESVGTVYNSEVDGDGPFALPKPAGYQAGDELVVFAFVTFGDVDPGAGELPNWNPLNFGTNVEVFHRTATGDSDDDFTVQAHGELQVAQMAAFRNTDTPAGKSLEQIQGGGVNSTFGVDWDVLTMSAGVIDRTVVILFMHRFQGGSPVAGKSIVDSASNVLEVIGEHTATQTVPQDRNVWFAWYWGYQENPSALPAFEQGYTPDPTSAGQRTQYTRWRLI